jgi:hypothetical protein
MARRAARLITPPPAASGPSTTNLDVSLNSAMQAPVSGWLLTPFAMRSSSARLLPAYLGLRASPALTDDLSQLATPVVFSPCRISSAAQPTYLSAGSSQLHSQTTHRALLSPSLRPRCLVVCFTAQLIHLLAYSHSFSSKDAVPPLRSTSRRVATRRGHRSHATVSLT